MPEGKESSFRGRIGFGGMRSFAMPSQPIQRLNVSLDRP